LFEERSSSKLRRLFWSKRDEVTGDWGALCNEELHNLYSSPNITRVIKWGRIRWAKHGACMREMINRSRDSVGKPRRTSEDNIKTDLVEIGLEGVDSINMA
jgi:hypothetical protein